MSNGTRTRDILDHNQVLYQLSYTHHVPLRLSQLSGSAVESGNQAGSAAAFSPVSDPWCLAASSRSESVFSPGGGTNSASR